MLHSRIIAGLLTAFIATGALALDEPHKYFQQFGNSGVLQNEDYFPLGVWLQPAFDIAAYKAAGINLYVTGESSATFAIQCKSYGMPVIMHQSADLLSRMALFQNVIVGWGQQDEPDNAQANGSGGYDPCVSEAELLNRYTTMQAADSTRPVYLNFGQGVSYIDYIGRGTCTGNWQMYPGYCEAGDIVCFDIYPANSKYALIHNNLWYVPKGVDSLRSWTDDAKPVWTYIECTEIGDNDGSKPSVAQVKSEIWMSIVHGANAIMYFCHSFAAASYNDDALLDDAWMLQNVTEINTRITSLAPVLNSPTVTGRVTCSAANVDILVKEYDGDLFIFAAEMTGATAAPTFTVTSAPAAEATVLDENRTLTVSGSGFSDSFGAYGVHLYQIGGNYVKVHDVPDMAGMEAPVLAVTGTNPFRTATEITVTDARGNAPAQLAVYGADGSLVRMLDVRQGKAVWDGTDASGIRGAGGMYVISAGYGGSVSVMFVK